jgi:hypothetical protein
MRVLRKAGFAVLIAAAALNIAVFSNVSKIPSLSVENISLVDGYYVYLYAHAGDYFYISGITFIKGKSVYESEYIERREILKKQFINKVKNHSDRQVLLTDVYVIKQDDHEDREDLEEKRLSEISRQRERGNNVLSLVL